MRFVIRFVYCAIAALFAFAPRAGAYELVIPAFEYRTGPYAPAGIPFWNGFSDYLTLLNERDGGINGVKIKIVRCETAYDVQMGIACYEKLKGEQPLITNTVSTGITYQLISKAAADKIPVLSAGYGRTAAANGRVFEWVFNFPATYWSGASILVNYIAEQERGFDKLKGKKIALLYLNNPYGKEPIATLSALSRKHNFQFLTYGVDSPGLDQKAVWQQIQRDQPDWILVWGFGAMNPVSLKEAAAIKFPMNRVAGNWWASAENDVKPAGMDANGYLGLALHAPGAVCPVHSDVQRYVYGGGKAVDPSFRLRVGEVLYNRGLATAMWSAEAIAKAMEIHRKKEVTGADVRDGLEALELSEERLEQLGFEGMLAPLTISCSNHEGSGKAAIQQWDAKTRRWRLVSGFYEPDASVIGPLIAAESAAYAKENQIVPRKCK
jgi:branched-chain amino acid transport system substrate-binding protein